MKGFFDRALNAANSFGFWDYVWLKLSLIFCGIILGAYLSQFFIQYMTIVWAIFAVTFLWIIYKTFFKYWNKK
jgi:hypothetical protein